MPIVEIVDIPYTTDAEPFFEQVRDLPHPVWLDSGKPLSLQGRFDIISAAPGKILETRGLETRLIEGAQRHISTDDPFEAASRLVAELETPPEEFNQFPFVGGLIGFWSYDLGRRLETLPESLPGIVDLPDMHLGLYFWALVLNHSAQKAWLFFHRQCPSALRRDIQQRIASAGTASARQDDFKLSGKFSASMSSVDHQTAVDRIKRYIKAGDCYQVNLAQHFSADFEGDSWAAYRMLRRVLPSPFSAYLSSDDHAILSLSPERFLKVSMNQVETKPIKGTIARGKTVSEDHHNAVALLNSEKDRAENLMIVDLLRNDLGKSCQPGTIRVPKLFALESFPNVHHLVSTITGTLAAGQTPLSLLRGCFPGGSITGTPKKRAMEIIEELESCRRSLYCGSIGYLSCTGRMDTNIAIRSLLAEGGKLHCWGGGGIVEDSDPAAEYRESLDKISVLMRRLEETMPH